MSGTRCSPSGRVGSVLFSVDVTHVRVDTAPLDDLARRLCAPASKVSPDVVVTVDGEDSNPAVADAPIFKTGRPDRGDP
jgi:hypothetical protein